MCIVQGHNNNVGFEDGCVTSFCKKANHLFAMKDLDVTPISLSLSHINASLALEASRTVI